MLTLRNHAMQRRSQGVAKGHANTRKPRDAASVSRCGQIQVKVEGVGKRHANTRKHARQRGSQGVAKYMLTLGNNAMQRRSQGVAKRHANTRNPRDAASVTMSKIKV